MKNSFNSVQMIDTKSNSFDLTHDVKMTGRMGEIMPCMVRECYPGDHYRIGTDYLVKFMPLIAPVMDTINCFTHTFFVPTRLVWPDFEGFITQSEAITRPFIRVGVTTTAAQQRFMDFFGIPPFAGQPGATGTIDISAVPFAAYQFIYNEYYRGQKWIPEVDWELINGDNTANTDLLTMRLRAYSHDMFTSALPDPQSGTAVDIPLGPIVLTDPLPNTPPVFQNLVGAAPDGNLGFDTGTPDNINTTGGTASLNDLIYNPMGTLSVGSTSITNLRLAVRTQEYLEKLNRAGSRFTEWLKGIWNVVSGDARLQRPEYITGTKSPVIISEVRSTAEVDAGLPQGNMSGNATSFGQGFTGSYHCKEHGYLITVMTVMPRATYSNGIDRHFLRREVTDYYVPDFQHIGDQAIYNAEVFAYSPTAPAFDEFGYAPRFSELRYMPPRVAGLFRTDLSFWTLARRFNDNPGLNQDFIEVDASDANLEEIFAVFGTEDNIMISVTNLLRGRLKLSVYGTPNL